MIAKPLCQGHQLLVRFRSFSAGSVGTASTTVITPTRVPPENADAPRSLRGRTFSPQNHVLVRRQAPLEVVVNRAGFGHRLIAE